MEEAVGSWINLKEAWINETNERESVNPAKLCSYGIKPLDDALFRIGKNELILIGADTGSGKSDLALNIAQYNAKLGKQVGVYYLEGGYIEAIQRIKWREMTQLYYDKYKFMKLNIDFKKWAFNEYSETLSDIESEVYKEIERYKDNLHFFPVTKEFTIEKFVFSLMDFCELLTKNLYLDLIVIDHLQYFSLTKAENEITEITKILREVKNITEYYQTPVILISHLRKRGKGAGLPSHEDFYGSSNAPKIATTAIMISPATDRDMLDKNIYPTYLRVVKSRVGVRPTYAFLVNYDLNKRDYEKEYELYRVNNLGEVYTDPINYENLPKWAKTNT